MLHLQRVLDELSDVGQDVVDAAQVCIADGPRLCRNMHTHFSLDPFGYNRDASRQCIIEMN
jgi:hypothetical protein